jgi:hypothetical protein
MDAAFADAHLVTQPKAEAVRKSAVAAAREERSAQCDRE